MADFISSDTQENVSTNTQVKNIDFFTSFTWFSSNLLDKYWDNTSD